MWRAEKPSGESQLISSHLVGLQLGLFCSKNLSGFARGFPGVSPAIHYINTSGLFGALVQC